MGYDIPADHHGSLPPPKEVDTSQQRSAGIQIVAHLRAAQSALQGAVMTAQQHSPLTASIPAFQRMETMSKEIATLMLEVSKMRGL